jgi:hypothetical protein
METNEGLLYAYFEQAFREIKETGKADWLMDCARMATRMTLLGRDEATWAAKINLGQCEVPED